MSKLSVCMALLSGAFVSTTVFAKDMQDVSLLAQCAVYFEQHATNDDERGAGRQFMQHVASHQSRGIDGMNESLSAAATTLKASSPDALKELKTRCLYKMVEANQPKSF